MQTILDGYIESPDGSTIDTSVLVANANIRDDADGLITQDDVTAITELQDYFTNTPFNASDFPASIEVYLLSYDNKDNDEALRYFNSSKYLLNKHENFLKAYVFSLVADKYNKK